MPVTQVSFGPWPMENSTLAAKLDHFCRSTSGPPPGATTNTKVAWVNQKVYDYVELHIRLGRQMQKKATDDAATASELVALTFADPT